MESDLYMSFDRRQQRMVLVQSYGGQVSRVAIKVCDIPAVLQALQIAAEGVYEVFERADANLQILKVVYPAGQTPEKSEEEAASKLKWQVSSLQSAMDRLVDEAEIQPELLELAGLQKPTLEMYVRHNQHPLALKPYEEENTLDLENNQPERVPEESPAPARISPSPSNNVPGAGDSGFSSSSIFD